MDQAIAARRSPLQTASAPWHRRWRSELLLAVVVLLLALPNMQPLMAQQASRHALTAALYDQRTIVLDDYGQTLGVDHAVRDGHIYSDKAPGQPVWALPAYAVYRLAGGEPATVYRPWGNLGLWATSVWSAAVPAALLAVLMRRIALRVAPRCATVAALGLAVSSLLLPFATVLFAHVFTGLLLLGAYLLLLQRPTTPRHLFAAGSLCASAIATEYHAVLGAAVLGVFVLWRHRRATGWFVAGGVIPGALLAVYQWAAFGSVLRVGYHYGQFRQPGEQGMPGVNIPRIDMALQILFGERGLFFLTPIVLLGVVGALALLRDGRRRSYGAVALAVFAAFLVHMSGWGNATGGASPGPRYVVPALPFLVVGVAEGWRRWPVAGWLATAFGFFAMAIATLTLPLAPQGHPFALAYWIRRVQDGEWAQTLLTRPFDTWTLFVPVAAAVAVAAWLLWSERRSQATSGSSPNRSRSSSSMTSV